ncbi:hypothetical protein D9613_009240 [Agrocybe pediades]|uniref:Uncharacterized protein n=1 Tax=Agrocybe pediades TaxID=84607 RepID=A0A8H4VVY1_9AGAR|nr:hypothetical protein D9613_009240 [Agrocybe pediades]
MGGSKPQGRFKSKLKSILSKSESTPSHPNSFKDEGIVSEGKRKSENTAKVLQVLKKVPRLVRKMVSPKAIQNNHAPTNGVEQEVQTELRTKRADVKDVVHVGGVDKAGAKVAKMATSYLEYFTTLEDNYAEEDYFDSVINAGVVAMIPVLVEVDTVFPEGESAVIEDAGFSVEVEGTPFDAFSTSNKSSWFEVTTDEETLATPVSGFSYEARVEVERAERSVEGEFDDDGVLSIESDVFTYEVAAQEEEKELLDGGDVLQGIFSLQSDPLLCEVKDEDDEEIEEEVVEGVVAEEEATKGRERVLIDEAFMLYEMPSREKTSDSEPAASALAADLATILPAPVPQRATPSRIPVRRGYGYGHRLSRSTVSDYTRLGSPLQPFKGSVSSPTASGIADGEHQQAPAVDARRAGAFRHAGCVREHDARERSRVESTSSSRSRRGFDVPTREEYLAARRAGWKP